MPEIILKIRPDVLDRIESSFQSSLKKCPPERSLTPYWVKHSSLISCKRVARNSVLVSGESGFNFPRARYGGLDYINTLEKVFFIKDTLRRWEKKGHRLSLPPHFGYSFLARKLSYDFLRAIYHTDSILTAIPTFPPAPRILEIGGGTGVLAHVYKMMVPQCQYVLVEKVS